MSAPGAGDAPPAAPDLPLAERLGLRLVESERPRAAMRSPARGTARRRPAPPLGTRVARAATLAVLAGVGVATNVALVLIVVRLLRGV